MSLRAKVVAGERPAYHDEAEQNAAHPVGQANAQHLRMPRGRMREDHLASNLGLSTSIARRGHFIRLEMSLLAVDLEYVLHCPMSTLPQTYTPSASGACIIMYAWIDANRKS
jgi:hypothetical protein